MIWNVLIDGEIVNTIIWDGVTEWEKPDGSVLELVADIEETDDETQGGTE
jgi:hypothetical protein